MNCKKTARRLQEEIPAHIRATFEMISANPAITIHELSEKLSLGTRTVSSHIETLKKLHVVKRVGGRTYGHWEVVE